jgi:hypothetical protein
MISKLAGKHIPTIVVCTGFVLLVIFPFYTLGFEPLKKDTSQNKSRYKIGGIPVFSYDADLGLKYGAVINLFDYGERNQPPDFEQYLLLRLTNTTKGTLNLQALLESETLINNATVLAEASYTVDKSLDFFGFNGTKANYNNAFENQGNPEFISRVFYAHERKFLRLRFDVQPYIAGSKLRLLAGFTYNYFEISPAKPKGGTSVEPALFERYIDWEIISPGQKNGGNINFFSLGLVYDSRNDPCYCTRGKWFETVLLYSPDFISDAGFTKFIATYRQHFSVLNDNITFSFRVSAQQKLSGEIPYYFIPTFYDSRLSYDGVGGAYNFRGAKRNRIAADGFIVGNFEVKGRFYSFTFLKQEFYASATLFYDNAFVTQEYKVNLEKVPEDQRALHFNPVNQKLHHTFGPGFYLVFNKNNVATIHYGFSTDKQLGPGGLYVGASLLF